LVSGHVRTFEFGPELCKKGLWRVARQVQGCEPGKTEQKYSQRGSLSQVRVTSVLPAICGLGEGCRLVSHIMRSEQVPRTTVLEGAWSALAGFGCPGRPARGLPHCPGRWDPAAAFREVLRVAAGQHQDRRQATTTPRGRHFNARRSFRHVHPSRLA
jgi:hypothetical protein